MTGQRTDPILDYATPGARTPHGGRRAAGGWWFAATLVTGLECAFVALLLLEGGHGWDATPRVSWVAIIGWPLSAAAFASRRRARGKVLAVLLLLIAFAADATLRNAAEAEGGLNFERAWLLLPGGSSCGWACGGVGRLFRWRRCFGQWGRNGVAKTRRL